MIDFPGIQKDSDTTGTLELSAATTIPGLVPSVSIPNMDRIFS